MLYLSVALVRACIDAARAAHPNESMALLQGRVDKKKGSIFVEKLIIPPGISVDRDSAQFDPWQLPSDISYIGLFHSHPVGAPMPSKQDILSSAHEGGVQLILAFPYVAGGLRAYKPDGSPLPYSIIA